ncbi:MAG TPA: 16S rRNA (cytosine(1402)-N(4))-methyltransferase, partial [Candidatus Eisenbacteria bacterium]|nr:16S rRNA (cytosine(1402)-N(4))-methyltransferase [Candidatus Eisenbacteria bacterium]
MADPPDPDAPRHLPVLSQESIELLQPRPGSVVVDGTVGLGGHARLILERIGPGGRLLGIDRDDAALDEARRRLADFEPLPLLRRGDFRDLAAIARDAGLDRVDGVLLDLGVSSPQLDQAERGFGYSSEGPLDMRMDRSALLTAEMVVNGYPEAELARILR